jgi:hypothetical protein
MVATDVGELGRLVDETGSGIVVRPDPQDLADALLLSLFTAGEGGSDARARSTRLAALSPENVARQTLRVYRAATTATLSERCVRAPA